LINKGMDLLGQHAHLSNASWYDENYLRRNTLVCAHRPATALPPALRVS
jgi:hypothetical protein